MYTTQRGLDASRVALPSFANVGVALAAELRLSEIPQPIEPVMEVSEPEMKIAVIEESEEESMNEFFFSLLNLF